MKKFEYKQKFISNELIDRLNEEGDQGWEVVEITRDIYFNDRYGVQEREYGYQVIFKREI